MTASVQSILAPSATRLLVVYKVNTAYAASKIGEFTDVRVCASMFR